MAAPAGYRTWSTADLVSAADFSTYIQDQVVGVYTSDSNRSSELASPAEGQVSFLTDTNVFSIYNGSAWVDVLDVDTISVSSGNYAMTGTLTLNSGGDTFSLPTTRGSSTNVLQSDGDGTTSWVAATTGDLTGLTAGTNIDISSATGPVPTITLAIDAAMETGSDGSGVDVTLHSTSAGDYAMYDASAAKWILEGGNGTTALDVTDGNVVVADGTLSVSGVITATGGVSGNVTGTAATVTGAAQSAITSVGTLTSLDVTGAVTAGSVVAPLAINAQTGTTYTFVLADAGKMVTSSNGSAQTLTVPPNSSVAYAIGTQIIVQNIGSANATLAEGSGVTINSKDSAKEIDGQYAAATLIKTATDAWSLIGALA